MTKEEILEPCIQTHREVQIVELSDAISCMDEYAKQQAIAFARWISDYEMEGSTERLYDQFIFLEQKNK